MTRAKGGFSAVAYAGDGAVLLAFNMQKNKIDDLAGFSIYCVAPNKGPYKTRGYWLKNRLSFDKLTQNKKQSSHDSNKNPYQMFRWVHFPGAGPGKYLYTVHASYFKNDSVELGPKINLSVNLTQKTFPKARLGFTRAYISSQSYADRFHNKPIRPSKKSIDFNTSKFMRQYKWLGANARKLVFEFLDECVRDANTELHVFAYDLDEPDIISKLVSMGSRVHIFQDDYTSTRKSKYGKTCSGHGISGSSEMQALRKLSKAGATVKTGHFGRFAHNKVMIQLKNGKARKVLTGSANFSVRGLYVQANSILVFDNPEIAGFYEEAFQQSFTNEKKFRDSLIASKWFDMESKNRLIYSFCFSPHHKPLISLKLVSKSILAAQSSVLFAVMTTRGGGDVMDDLKKLSDRQEVLSLGTIQQSSGLKSFKKNDDNAEVTSFDYLQKNVPFPFKKEWSGGAGQVIHHKFVVCDFNGKNPVVFCGSSNLSSGGEMENGDNLVAIYDRDIVTCYAVEAIRLFDHYRFNSAHEHSTSNKPLQLKKTSEEWVPPFYDPKNIKFLERETLCPSTK